MFGHDEELGGANGSAQVARQFEEQGVRLEYVLDEGLGIAEQLGQFDQPIALIGIAEKGTVSFKLTARVEGGILECRPR